MSDVKEILKDWQKQGIAFVRFELPDMHGISRSKTIPIRHAGDYAERGLNMYGGTSVLDTRSDVVGGTLYHEERAYADQLLFPDPDSAAIVPWLDATARFICDAQWDDGAALGATPRHVFRRVLDRCRGMGFEPLMGSEFEFYLLTGDTHEPLYSGYHIFNTLRNDYVPTIRTILELMPKIGVDIITSNCEYAGSQWEINFAPGRGLAGPDLGFTFKNGVKEIARHDGYLATFMSKPWADSAGSGCHTHMSLLDAAIRRQRVRRCRRPERDERHVPILHRGIAPVCEGDRRRDLADHELPPSTPTPHVQPHEHLVGDRGPLRGGPGEERTARVQARRVPGAERPFEPLPGRRRGARGRPAGDRGRAGGPRAVEARPSRRGR